jgi:hypothetical protein
VNKDYYIVLQEKYEEHLTIVKIVYLFSSVFICIQVPAPGLSYPMFSLLIQFLNGEKTLFLLFGMLPPLIINDKFVEIFT